MKKQNILTSFIVMCVMLMIGYGIFVYRQLPDIAEQSHLPDTLSSLLIQAEDRRFRSHIGVDAYGILRAGYYNLIHGQIVQGGSTIPQQLLKHYRGYTTDRSWQHKIQEMWGSILITVMYSKLSVLNYYINHVPFPNRGVVGYDSACEYYFDKQCEQLFESEVLFLIALAQHGSNPYHQANFDRIKKLSTQLCGKIDIDCDMIGELSPLSAQDLSWHDDTIDPRTRVVLDQYPSALFDITLTNAIDALIQSNRGILDQHHVQDCCIAVIGPEGQIVSYNQCRGYDERVGTVDMCRTRRQTGSAIKPFIYDLAFDRLGYTGGTLIEDTAVSYDLGDGSLYEPKNFDNQYHGTVTLAQALGNSFNIPAIKLTDQLGVATIINHINQLRTQYGQNLTGLESDKAIFTPSQLGLSVGLGTYETSPLEFARLWGHWYNAEHGTRTKTKDEIKSILSNPLNRVISFGQDSLLNRLGWFVKTGTSRKFVDGWTCGGRLDRELIVCVRVGNHDVSSMDSASIDTAGYLWYIATQIIDRQDLTK